MDHAHAVGRHETLGDPAGERDQARLRDRGLAGDQLGQRRPLDELHEQHATPLDLEVVAELDDVLVAEPADQLGLAGEAKRGRAVALETGVQDLAGVGHAGHAIVHAHDGGHGTAAELLAQRVARSAPVDGLGGDHDRSVGPARALHHSGRDVPSARERNDRPARGTSPNPWPTRGPISDPSSRGNDPISAQAHNYTGSRHCPDDPHLGTLRQPVRSNTGCPPQAIAPCAPPRP